MSIKYFLFITFALGVSACQNNSNSEDKKLETMVLSPEETIKKFQRFIDNNDFDNAIAMSTPEMIKILTPVSKLFVEDSDESGINQTAFTQIKCITKEKTAECDCHLSDEYEDYNSVFFLKKIKGKWLIDRTEDSYSEEDEESTIFDTEKK